MDGWFPTVLIRALSRDLNTRLLCPHLEFVSQTFYFLVTEYVGDKNLSDFMVRVVYASKCVCRTDSVHGLVVKL